MKLSFKTSTKVREHYVDRIMQEMLLPSYYAWLYKPHLLCSHVEKAVEKRR